MPTYNILIVFEITTPDGDTYKETTDLDIDAANLNAAEKILDKQVSELISSFSDRAYRWTLLEKCLTLKQPGSTNQPPDITKDLLSLML